MNWVDWFLNRRIIKYQVSECFYPINKSRCFIFTTLFCYWPFYNKLWWAYNNSYWICYFFLSSYNNYMLFYPISYPFYCSAFYYYVFYLTYTFWGICCIFIFYVENNYFFCSVDIYLVLVLIYWFFCTYLIYC